MMNLSFNPKAPIEVRKIGKEGMPLLLIDQFLEKPEDLVGFAATESEFTRPPEGSYYPGLNGALPAEYGRSVITVLRPLLSRLFGLPAGRDLKFEGFFGLALPPVGARHPYQTIPHFDSCEPGRLALVHYLCAPPFRGTAFYRHTATGYEAITRSRLSPYRAVVSEELKATPEGNAIDDEDDRYTWIDVAEARFNRLIAYSTTSLHSGLLDGTPLSADPGLGRLTANSFIELA